MVKIKTQYGQPANYNASPFTLFDGQGAALQVDANGNLKTTGATGSGATQVQGNVAAGATDSGNPVKVGGVYNLSAPTLTSGQRGDLQLDSSSRLLVNVAAASSSTDSFAIGDPSTPATQANVLAAGTAQSTGNAVLTAGSVYAPTFSVTAVQAGTTYDVGNYAWVSVQVISQYTGSTPTISFQVSDDGTNWVAKQLVSTNSANGISANNTTTTGVFEGGLSGRYFRLNFTGTYSSGTATGVIVFSTTPRALTTLNAIASQTGTWTVQPGNTANTTPWLVNAGANPTGTTLNTYSVHLTSNTTTTPTSSTAYVSSIAISTEVVGTTSTVAIQDKQGTPLKLVPSLASTAVGLTTYNFQTPVKMTSGIDVITAGAAAATIDVWINYYQ